MLSYMEYKLITGIPLATSIYELWKNTNIGTKNGPGLAYSNVYMMAKKFERMNIINIEKTTSNYRSISRITAGEAYPIFKGICDNYFQKYFSRASEILKNLIEETAKEKGLRYQIIGGQLDPTRTYADIQIAIPEEDINKWKKAAKTIENELNYSGITTEPIKQNRYLIRKLQIIPLPYIHIEKELKEALEKQTIKDIHYNEGYVELMPYFLHLLIGERNG